MPLFSKNKPTQKVEFEGGFVEVQYLSKGVKDEFNSRLAVLNKGLDPKIVMKLQKGEEVDGDIPDAVFDMVGKVQEIEYFKLAHAIRSWSDPVEITEKTVKEMDEETFNLVSTKVNEMNKLTDTERKN